MAEILFIDKPKGITSFDVIRRLRRRIGIQKIGHAGTLDPNASGLLIVGVGKGTGRLQEFMSLPKTYAMDVLLGIRTDTGDMEGQTVDQRPVTDVDMEKLNLILTETVGEIELPAPVYSALKYKGKPLYLYARKGIPVKPKIKKMHIRSLTLIETAREGDCYLLRIEMECGRGTYARAVAEEIGRRLGVPATIKDLRRTAIGPYRAEDAEKLRPFA